MTPSLMQRISAALSSVQNARLKTDVLSAGMVADIATTVEGKVRFTLFLSADDDATLARDVRQAVETISEVSDVRVDVKDSSERDRRETALPAWSPFG